MQSVQRYCFRFESAVSMALLTWPSRVQQGLLQMITQRRTLVKPKSAASSIAACRYESSVEAETCYAADRNQTGHGNRRLIMQQADYC